jgi:phospholipid/cholesterol/gamma-HCH transport system ATP-binding protein
MSIDHSGPPDASAESGESTDSKLQAEVRTEIQRALAADARRDPRGVAKVALKDVWLAYGDNEVLRGISFDVSEGEVLCVLGGSGTGKSTILRLILRLIKPDRGEILISGRDICQAELEDVLELREQMGMVFQGSALFDSLSVFDNVAFPLVEHTNFDEERIRARVAEVLQFVDLDPDEVQDLLPAELSGGMKKRVGIARAIVHQPPLLLFDEPTSGLDPVTTKRIDELILKLRRELRVCAVVVTHDIKSAARISNQAALLRHGEFTFMGSPEEMFASDDKYVRAFLG